jgi:serine/threonine protein kinase
MADEKYFSWGETHIKIRRFPSNRFKHVKEIAVGGFGNVDLYVDTLRNKNVVIKTIRSNHVGEETYVDIFVGEYIATQKIKSDPNKWHQDKILPIDEMFVDFGRNGKPKQVYLVMEFMDCTLAEYVFKRREDEKIKISLIRTVASNILHCLYMFEKMV